MDIEEIIEAQGWDEASVRSLFDRYLEITGQQDRFAEFLQHEADEENVESESVSTGED